MNLKFGCPHCETHLSAKPDMFGSQIACPECSQLLVVPQPEEIGGTKIPEVEGKVKFLCPHCERRLSAVPHQQGKEMPCPHSDCKKPVMVPMANWKPIPTSLLQKGNLDPQDLIREAEKKTGKKLA